MKTSRHSPEALAIPRNGPVMYWKACNSMYSPVVSDQGVNVSDIVFLETLSLSPKPLVCTATEPSHARPAEGFLRGKINIPPHYQTHYPYFRRVSVHEDGVTSNMLTSRFLAHVQ